MSLSIAIQTSLVIFRTQQEQFLLQLLGFSDQITLIVNSAQTRADYLLPGASQPGITVFGTGLESDGAGFTAGTITGFRMFDFSSGTAQADLTGFSLDAEAFQTQLDALKDGTTTPGEAAAALKASIFDGTQQTIAGANGNDLLQGGDRKDTIDGGAGDDTVIASPGNDIVSGGGGTDWFSLAELGDLGAVSYDMKTGEIEFADGTAQSAKGFERTTVGTAPGTVGGTDKADNITGGPANDVLSGRGGNDTISGGAGDDLLIGNGGDDFIFGGDGRDRIEGSAGNDELFGGEARDRILGQADNDVIAGEGGKDIILAGAGNDTVTGDGGRDKIAGGSGKDRIDGGKGNDDVEGGAGNDALTGGAGSDMMLGEAGRDRLSGNAGDDSMFGGQGNDRLFGGSGVDRIIGGEGDDMLNGGAGNDIFRFFVIENLPGLEGNDTIVDFKEGDRIQLRDEQLDDVVRTPGGPNTLIAYGGGSIQIDNVSLGELSFVENAGFVEIFIL